MGVLGYLKQHLSDYFYAAAFVLAISFIFSQQPIQVFSLQQADAPVTIVLDPGHGGSDGGTQRPDGTPESRINLEISRRTADLLSFLGIRCIMTRNQDVSLETQGDTVRQRKNSDLQNRVSLVNHTENGILISIHQNFFPQSQYSGPQVFFSQTPESEDFARLMQSALNQTLAPDSNRVCKSAKGIYLMERISRPGILVECGFLSNPAEAAKLSEPGYQKQLACVIASTAALFISPAVS